MTKFIDRQRELATLQREYEREGSSFVVIYGRRRVGKTALTRHFCRDKESVFFLAVEQNDVLNRQSFAQQLAEHFSDDVFLELSSWEGLLKYLAGKCDDKRKLVVALDEFQYLGKAEPSFPSMLMRCWDTLLQEKNIMLILCGSLLNMMYSQVLSYDSPLYGRRTAQIHLKQIEFAYYGDFCPGLTGDEQIMHYAVSGGVPKYIQLFSEDRDIFKSIENRVLSPDSFLYAEPEFLLAKELPGGGLNNIFSLLKVIAAGNHKLGKIAAALETNQASLTKSLGMLMDLDIIERQTPVTDENPEKSKKGLYHIKDNFLEFWFKFVYPSRGLLEAGRDEFVMQRIRRNFIDNHVSFVYENICREKTWELLNRGLCFDRVGRWWDKTTEIDVVAYDSQGEDIIFGECKYSVQPKGIEVLQQLMGKAAAVNWNRERRREYYALFSRSGYTDEVMSFAADKSNVFLLK